ncbi:MAG TPA: hypothetical protein VK048_05520 [Atopostipes sp.]|nr:hypothetical protein [Atopostipes sp.]
MDDELVFTGWISDLDNVVFFTSSDTMLSDMGKQSGTLLYWYDSPAEAGRHQVGGLVELNWRTKYLGSKINRMSGWYTGRVTKEIGHVEYLRITEEEFNTMRSSDFLP